MQIVVTALCILFFFVLALWVQAQMGEKFIPGTSIPWKP